MLEYSLSLWRVNLFHLESKSSFKTEARWAVKCFNNWVTFLICFSLDETNVIKMINVMV